MAGRTISVLRSSILTPKRLLTSISAHLNPNNSFFGVRYLSSSEKPGYDDEHHQYWLVLTDNPTPHSNLKQPMLDFHIQTLAKALGSEEEAKKRIYDLAHDKYFGFACNIDKTTSQKLKRLPGVHTAMPDCYINPKTKDNRVMVVDGQVVIPPGTTPYRRPEVLRPSFKERMMNPEICYPNPRRYRITAKEQARRNKEDKKGCKTGNDEVFRDIAELLNSFPK